MYIPIKKARSSRRPVRLVDAAWGRLHVGGKDTAWAIHREHLRRSGCIVLFGPHPKEIYRPTSVSEVAKDLDHELRSLKRHRRQHPHYAILNLCRLIYTWQTGHVVISKHAAGQWALTHLPNRWWPSIKAAQRHYDGIQRGVDRKLLRKRADGFLHFAIGEIEKARQSAGQAFSLGVSKFSSSPQMQ